MLPVTLSLAPLRQVGAGLTKVSLHKIFTALEKSDIYVVFCMRTCLTFLFCFFFASLSWPWLVSISFLLLCNKLGSLNECTFIISQFLWVKSLGTAQGDPLRRVSQGSYQDIGQDWVLIWWFVWGRIWFTAHMIAGHIKFFVTVEFMAACFFKTKGEGRDSSNTDSTVLYNVIMHIVSPLPYLLGWNYATGPAQTQGRG